MQRSCICSFSYTHVLVSAQPICLPTAPPVQSQLHSQQPLQTLLLQLAGLYAVTGSTPVCVRGMPRKPAPGLFGGT